LFSVKISTWITGGFMNMKGLFIVMVGMMVCAQAPNATFALTATAEIKPTQEGSSLSGKVTFEETADGLKVEAEITGASPGKHGFHIHEKGDCGDSGNAAGPHFNPDALPHGNLLKEGLAYTHAGDLGNIEIDEKGSGHLHAVIAGLTLQEGRYSVAERAVIFHEMEDDFGQPSGNAGGRVGCGQIVLDRQS
jgi:Cu-Zn family superoxide dismutase